MALFDQLPGDLNLRITTLLDLNFEELGVLRRVFKAWKKAVEEGVLGIAGTFHRQGLAKFACQAFGIYDDVRPALGILSEDGTMFHIHPLRLGRVSNRGLEAEAEDFWEDIPESMVVVDKTLYILSISTQRNRSSVLNFEDDRVKDMRLRSWNLVSGDCWVEKASLKFAEGTGPLPPKLETNAVGQGKWLRVKQTSFTVVASKQFIFVMHVNFSLELTLSGYKAQVRSFHGNLYDTLNDAWRPFALPDALKRLPPFNLTRAGDLRLVLPAASDDALFLKDWYGRVFMHSLRPGELADSWIYVDLTTLNDGFPEGLDEARSIAVTSGGDLSVLAWGSTWDEGRTIDIFAEEAREPVEETKERLVTGYFSLPTAYFTLVDKIPRGSKIWCRGEYWHEQLLYVDGKPLVLNREGGHWQRLGKEVVYVGPPKVGRSEDEVRCGIQLLWARYLPLTEDSNCCKTEEGLR